MPKLQRLVTSLILLLVVLWSGEGGIPPSPTLQSQAEQDNSPLALQYTAAIYSSKTKQPLSGLGVSDIRAYEDGVEQKVVAVELETKPLSVMLVISLGATSDCFFQDVRHFLSWLGGAIRRNLKAGDEIGVAVTDKDGKILIEFGETEKSMRQAFGRRDAEDPDYWNVGKFDKPWLDVDDGEIGVMSKLNTVSVKGYDGDSSPTFTLVAPRSYFEIAMRNAANYLVRHHRPSNRPVIILCNSIYNVEMVTSEIEKELDGAIYSNRLIVSWIGKYRKTSFGNPFYANVSNNYTDYYRNLSGNTGGGTIGCHYFSSPEHSWNPLKSYRKAYQEFNQDMAELLDRLRTRYRINHLSSNLNRDGKLRQLRLELAPKWKKEKPVIEAPQTILPPTGQARTP